ncbi:MAG: SGNH/GDSL hydrolase family protein [Acidimicrobiia bacterium]
MTRRRRGVLGVALLAIASIAVAFATSGCSTDPAGRSTTTTTREPIPSSPRVLVIGDSNLFESGADVDAALRNVGIEPTLLGVPGYGLKDLDAFWMQKVPPLLESDPDVVVVGLGTNDALEPANVLAFPARLDQMMELVGERPVVWLTHVDDRPAAPPPAGRAINELIRDATERWSNLTVGDFSAVMIEDPTILRGDGLHFSPAGKRAYAGFIAQAVNDTLEACGELVEGRCPD